MKKVEFKLSMPNRGSWNGRWSGERGEYLKYVSIVNKDLSLLGLDIKLVKCWYYNWKDGWSACVRGRVMGVGEKRKKSAGFCGYDWMVRDILLHNEIQGGK